MCPPSLIARCILGGFTQAESCEVGGPLHGLMNVSRLRNHWATARASYQWWPANARWPCYSHIAESLKTLNAAREWFGLDPMTLGDLEKLRDDRRHGRPLPLDVCIAADSLPSKRLRSPTLVPGPVQRTPGTAQSSSRLPSSWQCEQPKANPLASAYKLAIDAFVLYTVLNVPGDLALDRIAQCDAFMSASWRDKLLDIRRAWDHADDTVRSATFGVLRARVVSEKPERALERWLYEDACLIVHSKNV